MGWEPSPISYVVFCIQVCILAVGGTEKRVIVDEHSITG